MERCMSSMKEYDPERQLCCDFGVASIFNERGQELDCCSGKFLRILLIYIYMLMKLNEYCLFLNFLLCKQEILQIENNYFLKKYTLESHFQKLCQVFMRIVSHSNNKE